MQRLRPPPGAWFLNKPLRQEKVAFILAKHFPELAAWGALSAALGR